MRRIALYINGVLADIQDEELVLYNYAFTDSDNPTAVKNSFSKQVTLPGTPTNAAIFGHFDQLDRETAAMMAGGLQRTFNAMTETPFEICVDGDERIESGYLRLDEVVRSGRMITGYKVSLFGGLGSFFYALSYDADGNKKTLASLDYLGTGNTRTELDFNITAAAVRAAWARLASNPSWVSQIWDVLNFAPAYNGVPDGDFAPDCGYGNATALGLPSHSGYDPDGAGNAVVKFTNPKDEWAVKDLRSYLQRPVFSWRAFLAALAKPDNNGGYTFDYSAIPSSVYKKLWKTLPTIPSLGSFRRTTGPLTGERSGGTYTGEETEEITLSGLASYVSVNVSARAVFRPCWQSSGLAEPVFLNKGTEKASLVFMQLVGYANGIAVGGSKVICLGPATANFGNVPFSAIKAETGYNPTINTNDWQYIGASLDYISNEFYYDDDLAFDLDATSVDSYRLIVSAFELDGDFAGESITIDSADNLNSCLPTIWDGSGNELFADAFYVDEGTEPDEYTYQTAAALRSGIKLGKSELLASAYTPAEYLIGWAKINGFVFAFNPATKVVSIMPRDSYFDAANQIDLSQRIDLSKDLAITPLYASARWYKLLQSVAEGAFAKEYKDIYGLDYGVQKVNTGYAFDASVKDLLAGLPLRGAVSKLASGPYWNIVKKSGTFYPSPFVEAGNKCVLWRHSDGTPTEFDLPALDPTGVTLAYYNAAHPNYDVDGVSRLEFADKDGKGIDGTDVLCWFDGMQTMAYFQVSDDSAAMLAANDGKPCWLLTGASAAGESIPTFTRYKQDGGYITEALDFGRAKELDLPGVTFSIGACTMYERRWRVFLSDRLSQDTKVLRCRVDFSGMQVGPSLLRKIYYYDGVLWCLNKITNYSLTTMAPVECEFIQVGAVSSYTNGQSI